MGQKVQVYIYDISQGMARTLGPALIGNPLDVKDLGETEIPQEVFNEYLRTHSQDRFKGDRYDLFRHNCNNFAHETAQFLTGQGIPQHILDLPNEIMATPMGQMLAPLIQQMTPSGNAIPFTMGDAIERTGIPNATSSEVRSATGSSVVNSTSVTRVFPVRVPILLDNPLNVEGVMKKLEEFNKTASDPLTDNEMKIFHGVAKGLVRLSGESFPVIQKVLVWSENQRFPALDLLRQRCIRLPDSDVEVGQVVAVLLDNIAAGDTNAMLATAALANIVAKAEHISVVDVEKVVSKLCSLLPSDHKKLELYISTFLHNLSIHQASSAGAGEGMEASILILSSILTVVSPALKQVEAEERILICLGNILHCGHQEVRDLAHAMDVQQFIVKVEKRVNGQIVEEIKQMLKLSVDGIDLE